MADIALQPRAARPQIREATAWDQPQLARLLVHAAGDGVPDILPRLSARSGNLDLVHRRKDRTPRRIHRNRELRVAVGRFDLLAFGVQYAALHDDRERDQIRGWALSGAAAERKHAVQGDAARAGADPLHRADRAVRAGVLVDLRFAILDHLLVAQAPRPDHPEHQFP